MLPRCAVIFAFALASHYVSANECWALTNLQGYMAMSTDKYAFVRDKFSNPMVLCFNDDNTGTVTGDDTRFLKFGDSTLIGWAANKGLELTETYQIDRANRTVLFTKSRIGTKSVLPNGPNVVSVFVGNAEPLKE